jgi:hypothetical protein
MGFMPLTQTHELAINCLQDVQSIVIWNFGTHIPDNGDTTIYNTWIGGETFQSASMSDLAKVLQEGDAQTCSTFRAFEIHNVMFIATMRGACQGVCRSMLHLNLASAVLDWSTVYY